MYEKYQVCSCVLSKKRARPAKPLEQGKLNKNFMIQLSNLNRVMSKMAMIAIITRQEKQTS